MELSSGHGVAGRSALTALAHIRQSTSEVPTALDDVGVFPGERIGDKFGESLGGSQAPPSFWKVPGLPQNFPQLPRKFFGDFPGSSLTVEFNSNPRVPQKFPRLPGSSPNFPGGFPDFPGRQLLFLGRLTPSLDSQKLPLKGATFL